MPNTPRPKPSKVFVLFKIMISFIKVHLSFCVNLLAVILKVAHRRLVETSLS